jgi:hypothetical protein
MHVGGPTGALHTLCPAFVVDCIGEGITFAMTSAASCLFWQLFLPMIATTTHQHHFAILPYRTLSASATSGSSCSLHASLGHWGRSHQVDR